MQQITLMVEVIRQSGSGMMKPSNMHSSIAPMGFSVLPAKGGFIASPVAGQGYGLPFPTIFYLPCQPCP
jgi:hypothetical protein